MAAAVEQATLNVAAVEVQMMVAVGVIWTSCS